VHHGPAHGWWQRLRAVPKSGRAEIERAFQTRGAEMPTEVEAQIAGNLWKIEKSVGDNVGVDDVIMIIESMKMEIPVEAPCAGKIIEIRVQEGEAVEEGAILALIE
jgi:acetyl-CoA carboxylase biotin carboxyl carrier protein